MFESANKEVVEKELQMVLKNFLGKQCPVFKQRCIGIECMSYCPGTIKTFNKRINTDYPAKFEDWYRLQEPSCSSPLVTGYIEAEMIAP